jgi:DNA-binding protein HU-beta
MIKADLLGAVANASAVSKSTVEAVLNGLSEVVADALNAGDDVSLPGIGKLSAKARKAREGRNPSTGETIQIAAKNVASFKAAKALSDAIN